MKGNELPSWFFVGVRVQADAAPFPIDVPPFERLHFGGGSPPAKSEPADVRHFARPLALVLGRIRCFRSRADAIDLVPFEEAAPRVAFLQHREVRRFLNRRACRARLNDRRSAASSRLISAGLAPALCRSAMKRRISGVPMDTIRRRSPKNGSRCMVILPRTSRRDLRAFVL